MPALPYLDIDSPFPDIALALGDPDGLLAYGADLSVPRLHYAYSHGIFPWFSEGEPILWWSPSTRAIIIPSEFHVAKSLQKLARKKRYQVTLNHRFEDVIRHCASIPRTQHGEVSSATWITDEMITAYIKLHYAGLAHSVEVWDEERLIGGLYGIALDNIFCGESMFHIQSNASKLAMYGLVTHMIKHEIGIIDCQMPTEHLASLGAKPISRQHFREKLENTNNIVDDNGELLASYRAIWQPRTELL